MKKDEQPMTWISVDDALPPVDKLVLGAGGLIECLYLDRWGTWRTILNHERKPTHWLAFPGPPEPQR